MIDESRLRRVHFRAWHRGTKEADLLIGGFFDTHGRGWNEAQLQWFETLIEEQDVDIMAWAIGTAPTPEHFEGEMMQAMRKLDYIPIAKRRTNPSALLRPGSSDIKNRPCIARLDLPRHERMTLS